MWRHHIPDRPSSLWAALALCLPLAVGLVGCQSANDSNKELTRSSANHQQNTAPTLVQLSDYEWRLSSASGALSAYRQQARLNFSDGKVSFDVGCNAHTGEFGLNDGVLTIDKSRLIATRRGCEPARHQAESALADSLVGAHLAFRFDKVKHEAILIQTKDGETLVWQGKRKASAIYGAPVTLYWEISPEPQVCADGSKTCLKIRHVRYDENGIKTGAGAWQDFQGKIEGYDHEPNLRRIIRLKAYKDTSSPDKPIYVYDETIESARVR